MDLIILEYAINSIKELSISYLLVLRHHLLAGMLVVTTNYKQR